MEPFRYLRPADRAAAVAAGAAPGAAYVGGGTLLVDLMKLGVMVPAALVDVSRLPGPAATIDDGPDALRVGAAVRNSDLAWHPAVRARFPALSQALLAGASPQVRNMATVGGNLMQRTRCAYFRDAEVPACNKRKPGSGCAALGEGAWNRMHAVLGGSARCIAVHPSDMCVAMVALDAVVHVEGKSGARQILAADFHTLPGEHPEVETALAPGELITEVVVPATRMAARSAYLKVRDRAAFAFALASAAVAIDVEDGTIRGARVALGGLGTKPWRSREAEAVLTGQAPGRAVFDQAGEAAVHDARPAPGGGNAFKVRLGARTVARALALAAEIK